MVVAYDSEGAIGKDGDIPWLGQQREDMRRFRQLTMGGAVIMGSKTYDSLPEAYRPLAGRQNIVMSHIREPEEGLQIAHSLDEAYALANSEEIHVIGGGQIYELAIDTVSRIYATEIHTTIEDPDTYFPYIFADEWKVQERQDFPADEKNRYGYSFITYLRNHPIL